MSDTEEQQGGEVEQQQQAAARPPTLSEYIAGVLSRHPTAPKEAHRASFMNVRVIEPLRRALCGVAGIVTPEAIARYAEAHHIDADAMDKHVLAKLEEGFRNAPPLDDKLRTLVESLKRGALETEPAPLDDEERICDQLRDAGDTFLVISKVPTKVLCDRFVRMGWSASDAERVSFAIYKKKRPALPVVVVAKTKMEAAESAVDDQDTTVDISGCGLEKDDVEAFAKKLEAAPLAVTTLDASANTFHKNGANAICRMSRAARNLRELSIAGNNMQAPGVVAVVQSVAQNNPLLTRLDISNNFLTTAGAQQAGLVDAFAKTNPHLSWLGLAGNELGQGPGGDICAGLIALGKLRTLVLNGNKLGAGGIARMAAAIKADRSLQHLYIEANDMRDEDAIQLADALQFHPAITSLHLRRNPLIGPLGFTALAKLVKINSGLVQLSYDDNAHSQQTALAMSLDFNKKRLVSIHHKMVRDGGKDVSAEGVALWLRLMGMSAELADLLKAERVDGTAVWGVSETLLLATDGAAAKARLTQRHTKEFFDMLSMIASH
jgi:Ran GTPase-activating protein (RanGAP) involved in mRNA processing and transport